MIEYPMTIEPAKIYFDQNFEGFNQGEVEWAGRKFYFRNRREYFEFVEYIGSSFATGKEVAEWGMDYPSGVMTEAEVGKLFWHLVAWQDGRVKEMREATLAAHHNRLEEQANDR